MKVLIVDDEERFARLVAEHLKEAGHEAITATGGESALKLLGERDFDVVVTDLKMAPVDGMAVLEAARKVPGTEVVMMTAFGTVESAVAAMRRGAYDYVTKPFSLDELALKLERIGEGSKLKQENRTLKEQLAATGRWGEMVGQSPGLRKVRDLVAKVAGSDASVLILGESGVGKELVARMTHRMSPRSHKPFVVVHAAALPETLLESELFGYEKGAFTGATGRKPGRLEAADGGTLFLDEIGEIPLSFQVKLLRFLQERTFVRLGGAQMIAVDTRIVAATNRNLQEAVAAGKFRDDLYFRLSVFPILVPPLRERRQDIPLLVQHVAKRLGYNRAVEPVVMARLAEYDWPGNVRELENVLERALILAAGAEIGPEHIQLPESVSGFGIRDSRSRTQVPRNRKSLEDVEEEMLRDALRRAGGNKSKAAKFLGITRRMFYTKLRRFGIEGNEPQGDEG